MHRRRYLSLLSVLTVAGCTAPSQPDDTETDGSGTTPPPHSPPETPWTVDLTVHGRECSSETAGAATVEFGSDAVTVTGTIIGSDMCHTARLQSVGYDEEAGELTITVESVRTGGEDVACAQCITAIEYTAVATGSGSLPKRVVVRHVSDGTPRVVATRSR